MNAPMRRGMCPTLAAPIATGDGLLARLNPVEAGFSPAQLIGLCEAAQRHGNGLVEITARGSLQIRGLTAQSTARLADEVDALGIDVRSGVPVETGPLAGLDPDEIVDSRPLAERIRADIVAAGLERRLGPKVSVVIDAGGCSGIDAVGADVRLIAVGASPVEWQVAIAGDAKTARAIGMCSEENASDVTLAFLSQIAALGREGRSRHLGAAAIQNTIENLRSVAPPSVLPDISPTRGEISRPRRLRQSPTLTSGESADDSPISPQVGEMSGRTEGGNVEHERSRQPSTKLADGYRVVFTNWQSRRGAYPSTHTSAQLDTAQRGLLPTFFTFLLMTEVKPHSATLISGRSVATAFWNSL